MKWNWRTFLASIFLGACLFLYIYSRVRISATMDPNLTKFPTSPSEAAPPTVSTVSPFSYQHNYNKTREKIRLLVWSRYFNSDPPPNEDIECNSWCFLTANRTFVNESSAILWHGTPYDIGRPSQQLDVPRYRRPDQPWVFWLREPPYVTSSYLHAFKSFFNWTMTYRRDSDILFTYGRYEKISEKNTSEEHEWSSRAKISCQRDKFAVAVVSNCNSNSRREELFKLLREQGLQIDIFGDCGVPVGDDKMSGDIWGEIRSYKFYLAFENSLCEDYVTEKLWRSFQIGLVPIVYGQANYAKIVPPNSIINVNDFRSLDELVSLLKRLDQNETEYCEYLKWRSSWRVQYDGYDGFCRLCNAIERSREHGWKFKTYDDIYSWWTHSTNSAGGLESVCKTPEALYWWKNRKVSYFQELV